MPESCNQFSVFWFLKFDKWIGCKAPCFYQLNNLTVWSKKKTYVSRYSIFRSKRNQKNWSETTRERPFLQNKDKARLYGHLVRNNKVHAREKKVFNRSVCILCRSYIVLYTRAKTIDYFIPAHVVGDWNHEFNGVSVYCCTRPSCSKLKKSNSGFWCIVIILHPHWFQLYRRP